MQWQLSSFYKHQQKLRTSLLKSRLCDIVQRFCNNALYHDSSQLPFTSCIAFQYYCLVSGPDCTQSTKECNILSS